MNLYSPPMFYLVFLALAAFLMTLLGTRLVVLRLRARGVLVDKPNQRSNHVNPTPRGGGIAIILSIASYLLAVEVSYAVILGLMVLAAVSLLDDFSSLPAFVRLVAQAVIVSLLVVFEPVRIGIIFVPEWVEISMIILAWLWFINLYNFMDGIDGLASSEAITIAMGICFLLAITGGFEDPLFIYSLIVASAVSGFLWWNWAPAKIFMGDVGSIPLGFIIGFLLLKLAGDGYVYSALILPAYFVADASITLARRFAQGKKIWQAHSEHYYQLAVRSGLPHDRVVTYIFGTNLMLIALATYAALYPELEIFTLLAAYVGAGIVMLFFERHFYKKIPL